MFLRTPTLRSGGLKLSKTIRQRRLLFYIILNETGFHWKLVFYYVIKGGDIILKRLVVTGYKPHELGIFDDKHPGVRFIKKALEKRLIALLDDGLEWVIISGQLGIETWAVEVVID